MAIYSDYGAIGNNPIPTQIIIQPEPRTQVYQATHEGENYLPFMDRSFISFSYGGKYIEDFNLIAVTNGDRMQRGAYAPFDDIVTNYPVLNGQFYWGTYSHNNTITFSLATDGITQRQLDDFKHWFAPGKTRELILAEHPNRAIMARVQEPPQMNLLPFEKEVQIRIKNQYYNTSTTLYKGEIELTMIMDEPYWYAKLNIFGYRDSDGLYHDTWYDIAAGRERHVLEIPDALKIIHEDGIPMSNMIEHTMLFGGNIFASVSYEIYSRIIIIDTEASYNAHIGEEGYFNDGLTKHIQYHNASGALITPEFYRGARIARGEKGVGVGGRIAGAVMKDKNQDGVNFLPIFNPSALDNTTINFYYAGNAPTPVTFKFKLYPEFTSERYIYSPANTYTNVLKPYSTITIEGSDEKKEFKFTTPNMYTSYNQVIKLFNEPKVIAEGLSWSSVREIIRETVWHNEVRAWANRVIDVYDEDDGQGIIGLKGNISSIPQNLCKLMQAFFLDENNNVLPASFSFDAKTGEAIGEISHRSCIANTGAIYGYDKAADIVNNVFMPGRNWATYCKDNIKNIKENVGDMVKSKYLFIEERNYPTQDNTIVKWNAHQNYSHRLYHDIENGLHNIYVEYQNLYL